MKHPYKECSPSRVRAYKATRRPRCNFGTGCVPCWDKYDRAALPGGTEGKKPRAASASVHPGGTRGHYPCGCQVTANGPAWDHTAACVIERDRVVGKHPALAAPYGRSPAHTALKALSFGYRYGAGSFVDSATLGAAMHKAMEQRDTDINIVGYFLFDDESDKAYKRAKAAFKRLFPSHTLRGQR